MTDRRAKGNLKRPIHPMAEFVRAALKEHRLMDRFLARLIQPR